MFASVIGQHALLFCLAPLVIDAPPFPQPLAEWLKTLLLSVTVIPTGTKTWSSADKVLLNSESLLSRSVRMTTEFFRHSTTSLPLTLRTRTGVVLGFLHLPVISLYMFPCCCYWGRCSNNYCGNALVSLACCLLFAYNKQTHFIVADLMMSFLLESRCQCCV